MVAMQVEKCNSTQTTSEKNLRSISATSLGKSCIFWLPMQYENGVTIIIVPLKNLGQQLADKSSHQGFWGVPITAEPLGESPDVLDVKVSCQGELRHDRRSYISCHVYIQESTKKLPEAQ